MAGGSVEWDGMGLVVSVWGGLGVGVIASEALAAVVVIYRLHEGIERAQCRIMFVDIVDGRKSS